MALQRTPLTDFSAGEIGKKFYGRFDLDIYTRGCQKLENWIPFTQGGIRTRPALKYLGESYGNQKARYIPFVVGGSSYEVELTPLAIRIWQGDNVKSLPNPPIAPNDPIATPYTAAEIPFIQYQKVANQLYLVQRNHPIQVLTYEGLSTFSLAPLTIIFGTDADAWVASTAYAEGDMVMTHGVPHRAYKCISAGTSGTTEPSEEDEVIDGTVTWSWEFTQPFSQTGDYPGCIAYFVGRMWYGGSDNRPDTVWASMPYDFGGFDYFTGYTYAGIQLKDSTEWADPAVPETEIINYAQTTIGEGNAIELQLASENDESVMWLCGTGALVIGTGTSEWIATKDITALNLDQCVLLRTRLGSPEQQVMIPMKNPFFLQGTADKAYLWEYEYLSENGDVDSSDLTYLSEHMLEHGVTQMDFVQMPQPMWLGVTDGKLAVLLYSKKYRVAAWFWIVTDGTILSVCVVPGATDDAIYLQVLRHNVYCFERLEKIWDDTIPSLDSYYYSATCPATITGLPRLEGEVAWIYNATLGASACGTVTAAQLAVPAAYQGTACWVGLSYTCSMQSLRLQTTSSQTGQSGQATLKRIIAVGARVLDSFPFKAGYSQTLDLELAKTVDDIPWTAAYSGDVRISFQGKWGREGYLWIVQDKPQKTTILALFPEVDG